MSEADEIVKHPPATAKAQKYIQLEPFIYLTIKQSFGTCSGPYPTDLAVYVVLAW